MNDFIKVTLDDVTDNFDNQRIPLSAKQRKGLKKIYPYYGAQNIIDYVEDYIFDGEYILVAEDGENLKSQKNNVCNLVNGKFWVNNHAHIIKGKNGNDTRYLCYFLNLINFKPFVTGSAQPKLTKDNLNKIELLIHDACAQQKIANVLSTLDAKIELNNRINTELESMAKLIYDYWFVQFDFPDANGKPYKSSGGKMVWNEVLKREVPEGWEVEELHEIANITMGQSPSGSSYNNEELGMIFFQGSTDFGWRFPTIRQYTSEPSRTAEKEDILLSVRAPVGTLNIADNKCCIGRGLAALNSKKGYNSYLYFVMVYFKQIFDYRNNSGTTFGSITKNDLFTLKLVSPKDELLKKYDNMVSVYNKKILNNHKQNQHLIQLRDWLLPMLMNGQVRVE